MATDYRQTEEDSTLKRADMLGYHYLDTRTLVKKPIYKDLIADDLMIKYQLTPIIYTKDHLTIGITTMTPYEVLPDLIKTYHNQRVRFVLISQTALKEYLKLYNPPEKPIYDQIELSASFDDQQVKKVAQALQNVRAEDMLAYLVSQAFKLKISDIHCECSKKSTQIRMRVDGVLYPVVELSLEQYRILVGAVASAADLSTSATDSQTGHISQKHIMKDKTEVLMNLRIETIPTVHGMDIVMRFFSFDDAKLSLAKLGMTNYQQTVVEEIIKYPRGLVLVVGPTGSGKSTTLYSMLAELRNPQVKIITLEDPVEFEMQHITQIPIDSAGGVSFAKGLRTVLRLDPDVIMVGEIRDTDTAATALRAALTGHLVLSTYHATTVVLALITILKIADNSDPLFLNAVRLIQGQRLVRRLDPKTKQAYSPSATEKQHVVKVVNSMPESMRPKLAADFKLYKPQAGANSSGYIQRFAVREFLVLNNDLRAYLLDQVKTEVNPDDLEKYLCQHHNLITMAQEGVLQALAGETTLEELYRTGI